MEKIKFFVVYHKSIHEEVYDEHSLRNIKFFGVNENIEKTPITISKDIIQEKDLPIYDPRFQERGYSETSAAWHIYKNELYKDLDYIGFGQYDQVIKGDVFDEFNKRLSTNKNPCIFYFNKKDLATDPEFNKIPYDYIVDHYNKFFGTSFSMNKLKENNKTKDSLILFATFIIHKDLFEKLMSWIEVLVEDIYPWANLPPWPTHHPHLGGVLERTYGLFFALELLSRPMTGIHKLPIQHPQKYKIQKHRGRSVALSDAMDEHGLGDTEIYKLNNILKNDEK